MIKFKEYREKTALKMVKYFTELGKEVTIKYCEKEDLFLITVKDQDTIDDDVFGDGNNK